jgi:hypothetical protein
MGDNNMVHDQAEHDFEELIRLGQGENLFRLEVDQGVVSNEMVDYALAVDTWYKELGQHGFNFDSPEFSTLTGHFTQVIWKASNRVCMDHAFNSNGSKVFIVARYSEPGNVASTFTQNIGRLKTTQSTSESLVDVEEFTCQPGLFHYPHPRRCDFFVQCDDFNKFFVMPCPAGLHFSVVSKTCVEPENANCTINNLTKDTVALNTTVGTPTQSTTTKPINTTTSTRTTSTIVTSSTTTSTTRITYYYNNYINNSTNYFDRNNY